MKKILLSFIFLSSLSLSVFPQLNMKIMGNYTSFSNYDGFKAGGIVDFGMRIKGFEVTVGGAYAQYSFDDLFGELYYGDRKLDFKGLNDPFGLFSIRGGLNFYFLNGKRFSPFIGIDGQIGAGGNGSNDFADSDVNYSSVMPKLGFSFYLTDNTALTASFNYESMKYSQYLFFTRPDGVKDRIGVDKRLQGIGFSVGLIFSMSK